MKNVGNSSRRRSQGVPKIFRAPMYKAHCAVIFAIAQLSCFSVSQTGVFGPGNASPSAINVFLVLVAEVVVIRFSKY